VVGIALAKRMKNIPTAWSEGLRIYIPPFSSVLINDSILLSNPSQHLLKFVWDEKEESVQLKLDTFALMQATAPSEFED